MDKLAIENSVCWYGHVLRSKDCHVFVLRRELKFEVESQRKKRRVKWKEQVEDENMKVDVVREDGILPM